MSVRFAFPTLIVAALSLLTACTAADASPTDASTEAPYSGPYTAKALATACQGRNGWNDPAPPAHIYGNSWYVGTCGISAILITSPDGHMLVDVGTAEAAPLVAANIEKLGFALTDIRIIAISHEHADHAGGLAEMQRRTGASVAASFAAAPVLKSGEADVDDPQRGNLPPLASTPISWALKDGEILSISDLLITPHLTPAHSPGSASWTWKSCEGDVCQTMTYADSSSAISADGYRFTDHPSRVAGVRTGHDALANLPCGILMTPHPSASDMFARFASGKLADPAACRAYAADATARFEQRLKDEAGG